MKYDTSEALRCTLNYTETIAQDVDSKHAGFHIIDLFLGEVGTWINTNISVHFN